MGFASGVMVAASVWSLLIPAVTMAEEQAGIPWMPAAAGFLLGVGFLLLLDRMLGCLPATAGCHSGMEQCFSASTRVLPATEQEFIATEQELTTSEQDFPVVTDGKMEEETGFHKTVMLVLAVALHNLPEGMAVGVALAGAMLESTGIAMAGVLALSIGIAIQNLPEGAIVSLPLRNVNVSRPRAFWYGVLSGIVEPIGAVVTILLAEQAVRVLPYLLAFAAGAMIYVVADELIPAAQEGTKSKVGTVGMALGFVLMMVLDVALG